MAVVIPYYRNYDAEDTTNDGTAAAKIVEPSYFNWTAPEGCRFSHWNSARDGSGKSWAPGDQAFDDYSDVVHYAIWVPVEPTYLDMAGLAKYDSLVKVIINGKVDTGGKAGGIPYGAVDSTSTSTVFTATVDGLTELYDGACVMLHNGVVTSASGFTLNVNGLGAKPCYNNLTNATRDTTIFNANYTLMFVYSTALDSGNGGWWIYRGYDANTNTIGYQLRTNSSTLPASDKFYRYRLLFTSADGKKWVPANTSSSTNATSSRTPNTKAIDPFGPIAYYGTTTAIEANANVPAAQLWQQYTLSLGYSFNDTNAALTLTPNRPVYLKCTDNLSGAHMEGIVQSLPASFDGRIYIYLGRAYSATNIELTAEHPVYWYDGEKIMPWAGVNIAAEIESKILEQNYISYGNLQNAYDDLNHMNIVAADAVSAAMAESATGSRPTVFGPNTISSLQLIMLVLNGNWHLVWLSGANFEMAPLRVSADVSDQSAAVFTLYARGLHSVASGVMGVDESWTITALPTDADGVSY